MSVNSSVLPLDGNAGDVLHGLTSLPKKLPPKLFYDATGSALFEQITDQAEYYLTATEQAIFERYAPAMVAAAGGASTIIELGAGTAKKTMLVLRAALDLHHSVTFIPVDVSRYALEVANARVRSELPQIAVHPIVLDYTQHSRALSQISGRKLILYIGSSIGNFEPMAAAALLRRLRSSLTPGDSLLLGADMRKPVDILLRAYDDPAGVTAQFNLNVLARINREFDADFDLNQFAHCVVWNNNESRIEMHLRSLTDQVVNIDALELSVPFISGETIHTENSYKFTPSMLESLARNGGFRLEQSWSDERNWFTVTLLRAE
ncbi:MAG TPA: L-histidine N(alpha)-methyltransferase [Candidatus Saccharimonadales bacterium]|nr:L-histidine N(alpha)-methyltransferase [Candidatus Saccharimonadales bacterium]